MFHLNKRCHHERQAKLDTYQCGSCEKVFSTICLLHLHLLEHNAGGSYHYDHQSHIAFPKYDMVCVYVQTDDFNSLETSSLRATDGIDISEPESLDIDAHLQFQESRVTVNEADIDDTSEYNKYKYGQAIHVDNTLKSGMMHLGNFKMGDDNENNEMETTEYDRKVAEKLRNGDEKESLAGNTENGNPEDFNQKLKNLQVDNAKKSKATLFKCVHKDCPMEFSSKKDQRLHDAEHSGKTLLSCHICKKKFVHKPALQVHIRCHEREQVVGSHTSFTTSDTSNVYCANEQLSRAETINQTIGRELTLHNSDQSKFTCSKCPKEYSTKQGLTFHSNIHEGKKFVCDICGKVYVQANSLKKHKVQHSLDTQYKCDTCGRFFAIHSLYKKHMASHTREKQFTCEVCGFQTHCKNSLKAHSSVHGDKQFHCHRCSKTFSRKAALLEHMHTHSGIKPYVCEFCAMAFAYQSALVTHRRIHTGQRPYKCGTCSQTFSLQHIYKRHLLTHSEERPYKCSECAKAFTQEYNRAVHMRQHTGEKPFACEICSHAFTQKCSLKNHMKSHNDNL